MTRLLPLVGVMPLAVKAFYRNVFTLSFCTIIAACLALFLGGCAASSGDADSVSGNQLRVNLDKSQSGRLLRYYFGGYADPRGADPFQRGLLGKRGGRYFVNLDSMARRHPEAARKLQRAAGENALNWDELATFLQKTYYDARALPATREQLRDTLGLPPQGLAQDASSAGGWFSVETNGVMTNARRRVRVRKSALRHALSQYQQNGEELIYPVGTTIVGDHLVNEKRAETTVMRKRADGFWDFFTYGPAGKLAPKTHTPPRSLKSPTECVGCHMGTRRFQPEKSFPAESPPGPHGPRAVHVADRLRDAEVTHFFQEHAKRSDMVLGLYNTLFVSRLRAQRHEGNITPEDRKLLSDLGL